MKQGKTKNKKREQNEYKRIIKGMKRIKKGIERIKRYQLENGNVTKRIEGKRGTMRVRGLTIAIINKTVSLFRGFNNHSNSLYDSHQLYNNN